MRNVEVERTIDVMPDEAPQEQQFDHILTTIFTCRSVVKYNSLLNDEQKNELIVDIDKTLRLLREQENSLNTTNESSEKLRQVEKSPSPPAQTENGVQDDQGTLQALYRMYQIYIGKQPDQGVESFSTRFNDVMVAVRELQNSIELYRDEYILMSKPIDRISSFIADLYSVFVEFTRALSEALKARDIYIDTEELTVQRDQLEKGKDALCVQHILSPLMKVYEDHQHLNARMGTIARRVGEATALLEFLEESLGSNLNRREEIVAQLDNASRLLIDLSLLLADYERVAAVLLLN